MTIRRLEDKDRKKLVKLLDEFYSFTTGNISDKFLPFVQNKNQEKSLKAWVKRNYFKIRIVYVAEKNEELLGFISGIIIPKRGKVFNKEGHIENLFISQNYRKKGVGKKLFEILVEEFKRQKCTHIGLHAFFDNKEAVTFYKHLGLKEFDMQLKIALSYEK